MTTFNSRDVNAWAGSLNFPHVRFAGNRVRVFPTAADFIRDSKDYATALGAWDHSSWQEMKVVQSGPDKVHFAVIFTRYDPAGKVIGAFPSLYIVTLLNRHPRGMHRLPLMVKRSWLDGSTVNAVISQIQGERKAVKGGGQNVSNGQTLLLAPYLALPTAKSFIEAGISFADEVGNIHLALGDGYNWTVTCFNL